MRPHNGRMRGNHSFGHALAVGATVVAVAVILALVGGRVVMGMQWREPRP